jgi:hypothetical protein
MKNLTIQKLVIISNSEKKARIIEFDPKFTVFSSCLENGVSLNRTGKSLALKCIYYSLGGELTKYPVNWKALEISTIIDFKIEDRKYTLFRHGKRYLLIDNDAQKKSCYYDDELVSFYKENCNYNISLQIFNTPNLYQLPVNGFFLPFYLDQDSGWSQWKSFNNLSKYKNASNELILFHTGVHSSEYYSLMEEKMAYTNEKSDKTKESEILDRILKQQINKYIGILDIEVDIKEFQKELDIFLDEINKK